MPLVRYLKAPVVPRLPPPPPRPVELPSRSHPHHLARLLPPALITLGSLLVTTAVWPIVQYQLILRHQWQPVTFVSPVPLTELGSLPQTYPVAYPPTPQVAGLSAQGSEPSLFDAKTWFPEADFSPGPKPITTYTLNIPELDIDSAQVVIDGRDLSQSLIHFPNTALPGQSGTAVIFGHSVLRQFYNPVVTNKQRYLSIFSKIMTLKNDDLIYLDYHGTRYTYQVKDKVEVKPEDVFILEQRYAFNELKLITCVPEGTYLRRGVVIARLLQASPL